MKAIKDYTNEELFLAWNETMWEMDNLYEAAEDANREGLTIASRYEEEYSNAGQRIAELNQEFIRRGLDTPNEEESH